MASKSAEELNREADEMLLEMLGDSAPKVEEVEPDQPIETSEDTVTDPVGKPTEQPPEVGQDKDPLELAQERIANAQRKMTEATQEASSLRRQVAELQQKVAQLQDQLTQQPKSSEGEIDTLDELAEEYPNIVAPLIDRIRKLEGKLGEVDTKFSETEAQAQEREAEQAQKAHFDAILSAHPDAMDVANSDAMQAWLAGRPPMDQQVLQSGTAADVIDLLHRFKSSQAKPAQESKLDRAREVATPNPRSMTEKTSKPTFTRQQIANMSMEEFRRNETAIDAAYEDGRVI
jgi:chromosome segregation ATPase